MRQTAYSALTQALFSRAAAVGQPLSGTFELTSRCNLACRMCYVRQAPGDLPARAGEMAAGEWVELARQAVDAGMVFLHLTGGEVCLRPDFFDIYEPLTQMGLNLTVFTNATLMSPEIAACFARNPPNRLEVTVYGATRATYEAITGVPGSYDRCLTGIEMLLGTGITMALKITLTRDNLGELEAARRMAHERGLPLKVGWLLTHRRDGAASDVDEMRLPARDCIALEADDTEACRVWSELGPSPDGAHTGGLYCMAGKAAFFVGPTGEMGVCIDLQAPAVRPLQVGFLAAWEQVRQYAREVPPSAECATCSLQDYCPTCPARALLETGSLTGVDRYCCEIARARRDRFASGIQT